MDSDTYEFAVTAHWSGGFDEVALQAWAGGLRRKLKAPTVSLGLVFMAPRYFPHAAQVLEILRVHACIPVLAGCSSGSLIAGGREIEGNAGLVLGLYHLPGAELRVSHFTQTEVDEAQAAGSWTERTGVAVGRTNGWLVFADPFHMDSERWLASWNQSYPRVAVLGGLASGDAQAQRTQVYLNDAVFEEGGVTVSVGGAVRLSGVVSQGCTPIGQPWTITRSEGNLIQTIGNRPAYQVLAETFNALPEQEQRRAQGNLFVGLVIDEYREEFHRGDFLIRNLLGFDPSSGVLAVGARPRAGQSLQFQTRDAAAATEDMTALLNQARERMGKAKIYGGCLCSCNGRGTHLFGQPNHDADLVQKHLGPLPLTGFFCNGEIGPVGDRNFLHGYTAALALFMEK